MPEKDSINAWVRYFTVALMMVVFTFAAININQYLYGIDNQTLKISFLKKFLNPNLYPNDPLVNQEIYFYTFFWKTLGYLIRYLSIKMTVLFFLVHSISLFLTFLAMYRLAVLLFRNKSVALLAMFFLLFSKDTLGGDATVYRVLDTAMVARPILLFAMYYYFKERFLKSYLLQGLAFLIHPLSAIYMIAILGTLSLANMKQIGLKKFGIYVAVLILLISPSLIWKMRYSPTSLNLFSADRHWIELLRLRSSHHLFPFSWERGTIFQAALYLLAFLVSWKRRPEWRYHRLIVYSSLTLFLLWGIATVFSEWLPMPIILQLQLFRSAYFLYIFAVLYIANYVYHQLGPHTNVTAKFTAILFAAALLYHARVWQIALGAFVLFVLGRFIYQLFFRQDLPDTYFRYALSLMVLFMGVTAFFFRGGISIENAQNPSWLAVQKWANQHSALEDLFIIPPLLKTEGFRVGSERSSYGDWKEGTAMAFNPAYGFEWYERMKRLGYVPPDKPEFAFDVIDARLEHGYNSLSEGDFMSIARDMANKVEKVFVVHFRGHPPLDFPIVFQNDQFVVYEVLSEGSHE
jgi:hypothetical protein